MNSSSTYYVLGSVTKYSNALAGKEQSQDSDPVHLIHRAELHSHTSFTEVTGSLEAPGSFSPWLWAGPSPSIIMSRWTSGLGTQFSTLVTREASPGLIQSTRLLIAPQGHVTGGSALNRAGKQAYECIRVTSFSEPPAPPPSRTKLSYGMSSVSASGPCGSCWLCPQASQFPGLLPMPELDPRRPSWGGWASTSAIFVREHRHTQHAGVAH